MHMKMKSDPICNSSGCTQYKHPPSGDDWPKNYGVPNFGVDADVLDTQSNYKAAEENAGGADFDPSKLGAHEYNAEFELDPHWVRGQPGKWYS